MWICQRCQTENHDTVGVCPVCGGVRPTGRFGSAPRQRARANAAPPRVAAAQAPQAQETPQPSAARSGYQPPQENARAPRAKGGGFARLVGGMLCLLLPALTLLLAWRQMDVLLPVLAPLFTGPDAPAWQGWACYGALTLAAFLLSLLPGLWTLLLGRRK